MVVAADVHKGKLGLGSLSKLVLGSLSKYEDLYISAIVSSPMEEPVIQPPPLRKSPRSTTP